MSTCILVPVYHPYRWIAPFMQRMLDSFWADHPPVFFCGLDPTEAPDLPLLPLTNPGLPRDWCEFVRDAADELDARSFTKSYLLLEEHIPLSACHAKHLNQTIPALMDELDAAYIGLMGWDTRRFSTRAHVLGPDRFRMMHLTTRNAPRFHLHPALWRVDALRDCLELVLKDPTHTPWRFEKIAEKADAALPERWKRGCFQICGREMSYRPPNAAARMVQRIERFVFHKLMALYPLLPSQALGKRYWRFVGFDNYYYNGPYPMFFSGVMAKGEFNPHFSAFMRKSVERRLLLEELFSAKRAHDVAPAGV